LGQISDLPYTNVRLALHIFSHGATKAQPPIEYASVLSQQCRQEE